MFYLATLLVIIIDQLSKVIVPKDYSFSLTIIPNFFHLRYATNRGAAFSLFADHSILITVISCLAVVVIFGWHLTIPRREKLTLFSLGMIMGGAVGNLIDRFLRGKVIDFIDLHWYEKYHWPTFNLADTCICLGLGIFIIATFFIPARTRRRRLTSAQNAYRTDKQS